MERGLVSLGPFAAVGVDAARQEGMEIDIGDIRQDHEFDRPRDRHHPRHAVGAAGHEVVAALSARSLVGEARLQTALYSGVSGACWPRPIGFAGSHWNPTPGGRAATARTSLGTWSRRMRRRCAIVTKIGLGGFGQRRQTVARRNRHYSRCTGRAGSARLRPGASAVPPPRGRKSAGVLDEDRDVDRLSVGRELPALHHVELVGMRRAVIVDEGLGRNADGVDDQRVAVLVVADQLSVPGGLHLLQ